MTTLIQYHKETNDLALFCSDGVYWIGSYSAFSSHQNGEPPYFLIRGYWSSEVEGLAELANLPSDAF